MKTTECNKILLDAKYHHEGFKGKMPGWGWGAMTKSQKGFAEEVFLNGKMNSTEKTAGGGRRTNKIKIPPIQDNPTPFIIPNTVLKQR